MSKRSLEDLRIDLVEAEMKRDRLFAERAPIDRKIEIELKRIQHLNSMIGELLVDEAKKSGPDWVSLVRQGPPGDGKKFYEYARSQFSSIGLFMGGFWADTGDRDLHVMMTKGSKESLVITKRAIELIAPLLTEQDGMVRFGIFEHSLSTNGVYRLLVSKDLKRAKLTLNDNWIKFEGTLDEVLIEIQQDYYYDQVGD